MDMLRKHEEELFISKIGGRFKLVSLLEKRYKELVFGSRPLVDTQSSDPLDILLAEVIEGKIDLVPESEAIAAAAAVLMADKSDEAREEIAERARIDARQKRELREKADDEEDK